MRFWCFVLFNGSHLLNQELSINSSPKNNCSICVSAAYPWEQPVLCVCWCVCWHSYLSGLLLQVSDLVCNDCQFVASIGFNEIIPLKTKSSYLQCFVYTLTVWTSHLKTYIGPHLLDLWCQGHQVHGVSHSVGLIGTDQFQPAGGAAALHQVYCTNR